MKEVALSGENGRGLVTLVDDEDCELVNRWSWCLYGYRGMRYAQASVYGVCGQMLHRLLMGPRPSPGLMVDHINGDGLDNQRSNLRWATCAQNMWNMHARHGRSRFKGVCYTPKSSIHPWMAIIRAEGKARYLGCFATEEEAARTYDTEASRLRGEFANLNFPTKRNL